MCTHKCLYIYIYIFFFGGGVTGQSRQKLAYEHEAWAPRLWDWSAEFWVLGLGFIRFTCQPSVTLLNIVLAGLGVGGEGRSSRLAQEERGQP